MMIFSIVLLFGLLVAFICGLLIKHRFKATTITGFVTLVVPYLVILYLGHKVSGFGIVDLLIITALSATCSYFLNRSKYS
jgi:hypothetical protein